MIRRLLFTLLISVFIIALGLPNRSLGGSGTMEWSNKAEMPTGRYEPAVVAADGLLYVFGGQIGHCSSTAANEGYDPSTDTWTSLSALPGLFTGLRGVALDGKIYLPGGWKGNPCYDTVTKELYIYDPDTDSWTQGQPMEKARGRYGMALLDGLIYVMSGQDGSSSGCDSGSCETYGDI